MMIGKSENSKTGSASAQFKHPTDWSFGAEAEFFREFYGWNEVTQALVKFFQGVELHVPAIGTSAMVGRSGDKMFLWNLTLEPVKHP